MVDTIRNPKVTTIEDNHGGVADRVMQGPELARALANDRVGLDTSGPVPETPTDYGVASWMLDKYLNKDQWNAALNAGNTELQARTIQEAMTRALQQVKAGLPAIRSQTLGQPHLEPRLQSIEGVVKQFDSVHISSSEVSQLRPFLPGGSGPVRTARAPGE